MSNLRFAKCRFCGDLYQWDCCSTNEDTWVRHDQHPDGCPLPLPANPRTDTGYWQCYTCGLVEGPSPNAKPGRAHPKIKTRFSRDERAKGPLARCKTCVRKLRYYRHANFAADELKDQSAGQRLWDVMWVFSTASSHDYERVRSLVQNEGANPNHVGQAFDYVDRLHGSVLQFLPRHRHGYEAPAGSLVHFWCHDGTPYPEKSWDCTPLAFLYDLIGSLNPGWQGEPDANFVKFARLLVDAGADTTPAMRHLEGLQPERRVDLPLLTTFLESANASRQRLVDECQNNAEHIDFCAYISGELVWKGWNVTELGVRACAELRPYYERYTYNRVRRRLASQKGQYFGRPWLAMDNNTNKDGPKSIQMLPVLPTEIEAEILAMVLTRPEGDDSGSRPILLASRVPDPIR